MEEKQAKIADQEGHARLEDFMAELLPQCVSRAEMFEKRKAVRQNEEAAISQAISILHSDDARDTFGSVDATSTGATSFLQIVPRAGPRLQVPFSGPAPPRYLGHGRRREGAGQQGARAALAPPREDRLRRRGREPLHQGACPHRSDSGRCVAADGFAPRSWR